jgi:hypothetical protein
MRKRVYFDVFRGPGWPSPNQMQHYFLSASGRRRAFGTGNDSWGLSAQGLDGTEHLPMGEGRIDIRFTVLGNLDHGVLLHYDKAGGGRRDIYYSKGDLKRLREWVETRHGDLMPIGLFIPFERAWTAVTEFLEADGALPKSIAWIASENVPDGAFPDPWTHRTAGGWFDRIRLWRELIRRIQLSYRARRIMRGRSKRRPSSGDPGAQQTKEWDYLHGRIREVLQQFREEGNDPERKSFFLLDVNAGLWQHQVETSDLEMMRPDVIRSLQKLLDGYPNWEIVMAVSNPDQEEAWPTMRLIIRDDEIIDGLQRQYFPKEFQDIECEGSRRQRIAVR